MPHTAYIVEACRTAGGKKNGALREWHAADLGAVVCDELVTRTGIDGAAIDDVICGCVDQVGMQAGNIGRMIVLASKKIPESVPGVSVDRQCGSSQQALHFAAMAVMSGVQDCVIACGVESMTNVPIGANVIDSIKAGRGLASEAKGIQEKRPGVQFSQFKGAELLAKKHGLTREELDKFGYESQRRGLAATEAGKFKAEIVPVKGKDKQGNEIVHDKDEGIRANVSLEAMGKLKTLDPEGIITAATSSQICDGAAAILICNENGLRKLGLKPRAKITEMALAGSDPVIMLEGPIPATENLLKRANMSMDQIDLYEVNEAFAPVPVSWYKKLGADPAKLNVNGGACALGHPLGATGVKIMTTLLYELERRNGKYGVQAICEGGGTANATLIERVAPGSQL
ncbi:Acetyl-CoA acetyltransferase, mitochondrial [Hondaea fermentalgiana]|uniref:Acetyl-CoA acetyltransferase, mitochondrial n=1 Tax=Hondaea fermentalgiana TaxID=2315210 RepID=A0A2R5G277_9STRA|nr:Acetyl-CoA acetyltransferase, mitochondrial [Hondaea fermentalgiana]|eukprot:GBG25092.1 Acetyl-CoA acetyltransferase, mitochondrial [Hondaea fermentalgiana]